MPTNRHVQKEKVATYASVLLDAALAAGGQDAVLEVRDQAERIIRIMRSNMDLSSSLQDSSYTPEQRNSLARNVFAPGTSGPYRCLGRYGRARGLRVALARMGELRRAGRTPS